MLTLKLRNNLLHLLDDGHIIEAFGEFVELYLVLEGEVVGVFTHLGNHDLWMMGWLGILFGGTYFDYGYNKSAYIRQYDFCRCAYFLSVFLLFGRWAVFVIGGHIFP